MSCRVAVFCDNSSLGASVIEETLRNKCGKPQSKTDNAGYLYHTFTKSMQVEQNNVEITIDAQRYPRGSYIHSLYPNNGKVPDLVFIFSKCIGVNEAYRPGDLVIVDSEKQTLLKDIRNDLDKIADSLPESKNATTERLFKILSFLEEKNRSYIEIKKHLEISNDDEWKLIIDDVLTPLQGMYWTRDAATRQLSLNDAGKNGLKTMDNTSRKPKIYVGKSECTPIARKTSTTETAVDVIEYLSDLVFSRVSGHGKQNLKLLHVCVVKRQQNTALKADPKAAGEAVFSFLMKATEAYLKQTKS